MSTAPDWLLERILLGEVPHHLQARAEQAMEIPANQERLKELEALHRSDRTAHPAGEAVGEIRRVADGVRRADSVRRRLARRRVWGAGISLATLGLCLVVLPILPPGGHAPPPSPSPPPTGNLGAPAVPASHASSVSDPSQTPGNARESPRTVPSAPTDLVAADLSTRGIRRKGEEVKLQIHIQEGMRVRRLTDGDSVHPGDRLQLSIRAERRVYVWIFSRDASGEIFVHLPESTHRFLALDSGFHALPHAWELDGSTGFERFWVVWADLSFPLGEWKERLRRLPSDADRLPLPPNFSQATLRLPKGPR